MLTVPCVSTAALFALSRHVPVTGCAAPSDDSVCVTEADWGPLPPSAHVHVDVTVELFQPFAFGAGLVPSNAIVGGVPSSCVNVAVSDRAYGPGPVGVPTKSVHVPVPEHVCCTPRVEVVVPPDQPLNAQPWAGVAVKAMFEPNAR